MIANAGNVSEGRRIIFISGSRDLANEVQAVSEVIERLGQRLNPAVYAYYWKYSDTDFTSAAPFQTQLPDINDPNVRGVICLFGERVGVKLPPECALPDAFVVPDGIQSPWQKAEPHSDAIPLTGTLFEYFCARQRLAASATATSHTGDDFFLFTFFKGASDSLADSQLQPLQRNWGNSEHFAREIDHRRPNYEPRHREYVSQIGHLAHFADRFYLPNFPLECFGNTNDLSQLIELRLRKELQLNSPPEHNPFKQLANYDETDGPAFFGRSLEVDSILATVGNRHATAGGHLVLTGPSGAGKSSILRAGVLHRLSKNSRLGSFVTMAIRPRELNPPHPKVARALAVLVREAIGRQVPNLDLAPLNAFLLGIGEDRFSPIDLGKFGALAADMGVRLCLAVDQLEEIFYVYDTTSTPNEWMCCLLRLAEGQRHLVISALNNAWLTHWDNLLNSILLHEDIAHHARPALYPIGSPGRVQFREIINKSFSHYGLQIDPALTEQLTNSVVQVSQSASLSIRDAGYLEASPSVLPLLSVTISTIYDKWLALNREAIRANWIRQAQQKAATEKRALIAISPDWNAQVGAATAGITTVLRYEDFKDVLLADAVGRLGDRAWSEYLQERQADAVAYEPEWLLSRLLRRLVYVSRAIPIGLSRCSRADATTVGAGHILQVLAKYRLCGLVDSGDTPAEDQYELVHQSVVEKWPLARNWYLTEGRQKLLLERLREQAENFAAAPEKDKTDSIGGTRREIREGALILMTWGEDAADGDGKLSRYLIEALRKLDLPRSRDALDDPEGRAVNPLAFLVQRSQRELLKDYLEAGFPADMIAMNGIPAIAHAARLGDAEALQHLLDAGANVNLRDEGRSKATPLYWACGSDEAACARILLDHGADTRLADADGMLPAELAAARGDRAALDVVLAADTGRPGDAAGIVTRCMKVAIENSQRLICECLIESHRAALADPLESGSFVFDYLESRFHDPALLMLLLVEWRAPATPRRGGHTFLTLAQTRNRLADAVLIIEQGLLVDAPTVEGFCPLHIAAQLRQEAIAKALVAAGADLGSTDYAGRLPCTLAIDEGWQEGLEILVRPGLDFVGTVRESPLCIAVDRGHKWAVERLLALGADPNQASVGTVPIQKAVEKGATEIFELLVTHGADTAAESITNPWVFYAVFAKDGTRNAPLEDRLAKCAIPPPTQTGGNGRTALHVACNKSADATVIERLIDAGHALDLPDNNGQTPFHELVAHHQPELALKYFSHVHHPLPEPHASDPMLWQFCSNSARSRDLLKELLAAGYEAPPTQPQQENFYVRLLKTIGPQHSELTSFVVEDLAAQGARGGIGNAVVQNFRAAHPNLNFLRHLLNAPESAAIPDGLTAVQAAYLRGNMAEIISAIDQLGCDEICDPETQYRPIHLAVLTNMPAIVEWLIARHASVDVCDRDGWSPLMLAVSERNLPVLKQLRAAGADCSVRLPCGRSLQDLARDINDPIIFKELMA